MDIRTATQPRIATGLTAGIGLTVVLLTLRALSPEEPSENLPELVQDFFTLSISVVIESLPFVFLGVILSIGVQLFVPARVFTRLLPTHPVARRAVMSLLGVLLPVCECGNVPLARGLLVKGLSVPEAMTFLLAAPILNPVTIITTYQAFGWDHGILLGRILGGFAIANLIGWLFSMHPRQEQLLTPRFEATCHVDHDKPVEGSRFRRGVLAFAEETSTMLPALIVGSAVAGAIQVGVSRDLLATLGGHPVLSVLALMALAFIIAICSNVDAFFILSFGSTFLPGSIVAFLVFGAMVDVKMLALLRTTFTASTLLRVTLTVGLCCLVLGLGVNLLA
ncbi:permease [Planctomonas psychrotolerans]|uniref:permease n=1 Tax=Planctomonas psychrotolerans TaxID=2528712 RepID=UPI001D0D0C5A|nr:permease [Planctomonas psychrotolerans]